MKLLFLIFLVLTVGCKKSQEGKNNADLKFELKQTKCVERIFTKDSILGEIRNHASQNISLSQTITNYTTELNTLDFTECPELFVSSFRKHIEAWKMVTEVTDKYPALRGELHEIFAELEKSNDSTEFKYLVKQVWDTWDLVKKNAQ